MPEALTGAETARVRGEAAAPDEALDAAAELLLAARLPLVYGLVHATVQAQRAAVALADLLGAAIDSSASPGHGPALLAMQQLGQVSASLGEIRLRADLLVYWGVDPDRRHPGFRTRYVSGAALREIAVDVGPARGPADVAERWTIAPERETEALGVLRMLLRGRRVDAVDPGALGASPGDLRALAGRLRESEYTVLLTDGDPPPERPDALRSEALVRLVLEANRHTRLRGISVRAPGNAVGVESVLTWQTGYPFAVHLGRGYPRYGPGEWTGEALLARGDADAALLVGVADGDLPPEVVQRLRGIPVVCVGTSVPDADVLLPAAAFSQTPGSVYRMDGIPLHRRRPAPDACTVAEILTRLAERVRER